MAAAKNKVETVGELLYWSYANLAMAHTAVERNQEHYGTFNFVVRAKLFKGLKDGTMKMGSLFDDEKVKLQTGQSCNYCGAASSLSLDHIFPKHIGGKDSGENLVYACRPCNSSKGKKDLMEWMDFREHFLPLMIIRRYLKLVHGFCAGANLLALRLEDAERLELPFRLSHIPTAYPGPKDLQLNSLAVGTQKVDMKQVGGLDVPKRPRSQAQPAPAQQEFDFGPDDKSGGI